MLPVNAKAKLIILSLMALALVMTGCSKRRFDRQEFTEQAKADLYTKAKVDIVFFQDTSSGTIRALPKFTAQFNAFVQGLSEKIDFRIVVLPLQGTDSIEGRTIISNECTGINGNCLNISEANTFVNAAANTWYGIDASFGSDDQGFANIQANLTNNMASGTNFLRRDALLAVVVFSNGNDTTDVAYTVRDPAEGLKVVDQNATQTINSESDFVDFLLGQGSYTNILKIGPGLTQFISVVSPARYPFGGCHGDQAFAGWRYSNVSNSQYTVGNANFNLGTNYNICDNGLENALGQIRTKVEEQIKAFVFDFVVLTDEPVEESIKVFKNGQEVPKGGANGWSYEGYKADTPTASFPQPAQHRTGYFIRMNGSSAYSGDDVIDVKYQKL